MKRLLFPIFLLVAMLTLFVVAMFRTDNDGDLLVEPCGEYVCPLVGTGGHGHTHPAATLPFGMVQAGPDTRLTGWDGCSAYHYNDSVIYGFSHTHLSGTGCSDYADVSLMPVHNYQNDIDSNNYAASFSHEHELAKAGYYAVTLDNDIKVELTASKRTGRHRYTFPDKVNNYIIIDLEHRDKLLDAFLTQESATRVVGMRMSTAWAEKQILYFVIDFSVPVDLADFRGNNQSDTIKLADGRCKAVLRFAENTDLVEAKVALSAVDIDGAINNLESEAADVSFDEARQKATNSWNYELSKILVADNDSNNKETFYTALYHAFSAPNLYSDADGRYRSTDLKTYKSVSYNTYTVFSLWDTYRAAHPLYTLTQPRRTLDFVNTFLEQYRRGGRLPMWELSANDTRCMIGYHAVPVIVDAYLKGIDDFDAELALKAMVDAATDNELGKHELEKYGHIPLNMEHESVSKCLEYAYDDWCIAQFAQKLGHNDVYLRFNERCQFYKNILHPVDKFMRARLNAAWQQPFNPAEVNYNYTEANAWQYRFYVPHDILTLIRLHGGPDAFARRLDTLFAADSRIYGTQQADITGLIGQYAHGNEPSHHVAYLYDYCGQPWKTQQLVRRIMFELYTNRPDGLCGNEDCGQMSAWYVFSALGFYPVNPANGIYDLGSPLFDTAVIQLADDKTFTIIAHDNAPKNVYVAAVELNGHTYDKNFITHADILAGGTLEFYMSDTPNRQRGTGLASIYRSELVDNLITPTPFTNTPALSFRDSLVVTLACADTTAEIFYSLGDPLLTEPVGYKSPIVIAASTDLYAYAKAPNRLPSKVVHASYKLIPDHRTITVLSKYAPQYSAGGDGGLIDCLCGSTDFRDGLWQGCQGQDFAAIVDLQTVRQLNSLKINFLQDIKSWIFCPIALSVSIATDSVRGFVEIYSGNFDNIARNEAVKIVTQQIDCLGKHARYVKVVAKQFGKMPKWHISAGCQSWLFVDEIEINAD